MIDKYAINVDSNGLFVTAPLYGSDGGDSLANNASFALALQFIYLNGMSFRVPSLEVKPWVLAKYDFGAQSGTWVRNPDPTKWYSNPKTTSRDQLIPAMLAMGLHKEYKNLARTQWNIIKRGFFAQNIYHNGADGITKGKKLPDTFLGHLHLMLRCWGRFAILGYPLLFAFDLCLLISAVVNVLGSENKDPGNCDDRNGINCHIAALYSCPTLISWLARKIYSKWRPPTYASIPEFSSVALSNYQAAGEPVEPNHVMGALRLYFWENNPIIAEAYRPIIERYFV